MSELVYLSPEPQAEPQAVGFSSGLSPEPQAEALTSGLSPEPQAEPQAVGAWVPLLHPCKLESAITIPPV